MTEGSIVGKLAPIQIGRPVATLLPILGLARHLRVKLPDPGDLHVTLIWSRKAVDWAKPVFAPRAYPLIIDPQEVSIENFGGNLVLRLHSVALEARNHRLVAAGAKSDHPSFVPHITLGPWPACAVPKTIALDAPLVLGPEYRKPAKILTGDKA